MSTKQKSQFETKRLGSLKALGILDTAPDKAFDNLVELAAQIAGVPISLVSLVAEDRQWFKACVGLDLSQTPRSQSFCFHAIENAGQPLIVGDAQADPRFADNPLVVGEPFIRFYAGFPIKSPVNAMPLGTLCVIDQQPRELDEKTIGLLASVARQVENLLELHHSLAEQRKSKEEHIQLQKRLDLALETGNVGLWERDIVANKLYVSLAFKKQLGIPPDADISDPDEWLQRINPKDKDEFLARRQACFNGDCDLLETTYRLRHNDGFYRWIFLRGKVVFDSTGKPLKIFGIHMDVTDQQEAEKAIAISRQMAEESERRFRGLGDSASIMMWTTELDSTCSWLNQCWVDYCGKPLESQLGYGWAESIHPDDRQRAVASYQEGFDKQGSFRVEFRVRRYDGEYRWFSNSGTPRIDQGGNFAGLVGMCFDIHDERIREEQNRLLSAAIKNSKDAFLIASVEANAEWPQIVFINEAFSKMTGYQIDDLDQADFKTLLNGRATDAKSIEYVEDQIHHWQVTQIDMLVYAKDGSSFWANVKMTPIANNKNIFTHWLIVYRDIDEQKQIEAALELERHLLKESNADLEQFAYAASHDLQEPLRAVSGFLQLLEAKYADQLDVQGRGYIQKSVAGASRMGQLINDLLLFSHVSRSPEGFADVDLNEVVAEAQRDHDGVLKTSQARIEAASLPTIFGARPLLIQLFRNLIFNSIKYRSEASPLIEISSSVDDSVCSIRLQDNGIGIADEYRHQVFELFKRLHRREQYSGTGIGLAVCKRVVLRHGGSIEVESNDRPGTCIVVRLPINGLGL